MAAALAAALIGLHAIAGVTAGFGTFAWAIAVNVLIVVAVCAQTALQAENRYWAAFAISAVGSATRSFLPPLLAMTLGATLFWLETGFFVHVGVQILVAALFLSAAWRREGALPDGAGESLARTVSALAGAGLCGWLAAAAPRWIAAAVLTPEETGYFVLAGNLTLVVPASFGAIVLNRSFPGLFGAAREGADGRALLRMTDRSVAAVLAGSQLSLLALAWLSPVLVGTVVSPRYANSMDWLLATGGAALATTTTQFYHNVLLARHREGECLKLSIASAACRLVAMAAAAAVGMGAFRLTLIALPWLTVVLERAYVQRLLATEKPAATPA
jgi:O-antigen/teichoic acid export membrane protein